MFEKIKLTDDEGNELEVSVIEQTKINNTSYLLVTDSEDDEEEINAFIVKDLSSPEDEDAIYEFVEDDDEFDSVARIFDELVDEGGLTGTKEAGENIDFGHDSIASFFE